MSLPEQCCFVGFESALLIIFMVVIPIVILFRKLGSADRAVTNSGVLRSIRYLSSKNGIRGD